MATARKIIQHRFVTPEIKEQFNKENVQLGQAFIMYKQTTDKSPRTVKNYSGDLNIIWYWNLMYNHDKLFLNWTKHDILAFQSWCIEDCQHSSSRVRGLKSIINSMSNFVEDILDDDYPDFKKISHKIPSPPLIAKLPKSVFAMHDINVLLGYLTFSCQYKRACCLALAICSGRRKAELVQFKLSDFTEDRLVCDGALYKSAPIRTKGRGKAGKPLECFILAVQFQPYLDRWLSYRARHGIQSEWLFPNPDNPSEHLTPSALDTWAKKFNEHTELPFYWHSMRHLTVTNFVRAGIPDRVIQEYIGWDNMEMISHYSDLAKEEAFAMYFNADGSYGGVDGNISDINMKG